MKRTILFGFAAMAALLLSACSELNYDGPKTEIELDALTNMMTKASSAGPINNTTFATGRTILLSAYYNDPNGTSHSQNYFTDIPFTYYSSKWAGGTSTATNPKYWPHQGTLNFIGLSKEGFSSGTVTHGGATVATSVTFAMPDNSTNQDDVMIAYAGGKAKPSDGKVALSFKHCQAQIAVTAKAGVNDATNNYGISIRSMTLRKARYSGTVTGTASGTDGVTISWANVASGTQANRSFGSTTTRLTTTAAAYGSGILVPNQSPTGAAANIDILVEYTIHNGKDASGNALNTNLSYVYTVPATDWTAGNKYTYAFTIGLTEITCTPSVASWGSGTGASPSI